MTNLVPLIKGMLCNSDFEFNDLVNAIIAVTHLEKDVVEFRVNKCIQKGILMVDGEKLTINEEIETKSTQEQIIDFKKHLALSGFKIKIKECLHPQKDKCSKSIIRAHSIQNNGILKEISEKGNLLFYDPAEGFITKQLTQIGRGAASTFYGFCDFHDSSFFSPIETKKYEHTNKQNFLFFYRALAKEILEKKQSLITYQRLKSEGNPMAPFYIIGTQKAIRDLNILKEKLDTQILADNFSKSITQVRIVNKFFPIAVCSCFAPEYTVSGDKLNHLENLEKETSSLFYNIFPQGDKTYFLISYHSDYKDLIEQFLSEFWNLEEKEYLDIISKIICDYSENFVIRPSYWNGFSEPDKVIFMKQYESIITSERNNRHLNRHNFCRLFK